MQNVNLICPSCGYCRTTPASRIPSGAKSATCPQCDLRFPFVHTAGHEEAGDLPQGSRSLGQLFDDAWHIYQQRWKTLTALFLSIYALLLAPTALGFGIGLFGSIAWPEAKTPLLIAGTATGMLVGMVIMFWGYAAFIAAAVDPQLRFRSALQSAGHLIWPFLWTLSLVAFLVTGGMFLLLLPGLALSVRFLFVPFVMVDRQQQGHRALQTSRQLVAGHFWEVAAKFFIAMLIPSALGAVPVVGPLLGLLAAPYVLIMLSLIYADQKQLKRELPLEATTVQALLWWVLATAGYLLVIVPVFWLLTRTDFSWHSSWHFISCIVKNIWQLRL